MEHVHEWVPVYTLVHHPEEGHFEFQELSPAWDEPVYEIRLICNKCHEDITNCPGGVQKHLDLCDSTYSTKEIQTGSIHHPPMMGNVWIVDVEAYDEEVITGYVCYDCLETRPYPDEEITESETEPPSP